MAARFLDRVGWCSRALTGAMAMAMYIRMIDGFVARVGGVLIKSDTEEQLGQIADALKFLRDEDGKAHRLVEMWIRRIGAAEIAHLPSKIHFGSGSVLLGRSLTNFPTPVLAALIYRVALDTKLVVKHRLPDVLFGQRASLMSLRRQLKRLQEYNVAPHFIAEQADWMAKFPKR